MPGDEQNPIGQTIRDDSSTEAGEVVTTDEGLFKKIGAALFTNGTQNTPFEATDYSNNYAQKGYFLRFTHLPSGLTLSFKAFITNFQDNFTSNWNSQSVYGRMDNITTFQNTTRQLSVGFVVPAFDFDDSRCNLAKVSSLMRKLYPHYSEGAGNGATTIAKPPLMRVRFANLIRNGAPEGGGLLGTVNGFSFTPNLEHGFYDPGKDMGDGILYPKTIDISFTFDVLHEHIMGWTDVVSSDSETETITGVSWADGGGPGFPYATLKIPDPSIPETPEDPTSEDENANILKALTPPTPGS